MTENKKPSFTDVIKAAQAAKTKVPAATSAKVQAAKFKNQGLNSRPVKRTGARGG
jgi:hypothetical protein